MDRISKKTAVSAWVLAAALGSATAFAQTAGSTTGAGTAGSTAAPTATAGSDRSGTMQRQAGGDRGNLDRADAKFVREAAIANMAEIEAGKLAQQKASDPKVKQFAQHMVDDHTKASQQLQQLASSKGAQLPGEVDRKHKRLMDKLSKADGDDFDRHYMRAQVDDHEKTVKLFEKEAKNGKDADLKQFADQMVPTLRQHLKEARDVKDDVGKQASRDAGAKHASNR